MNTAARKSQATCKVDPMLPFTRIISSVIRSATQRLRRRLPKPMYLALLGACGCVFGALLGEALLIVTRPSTSASPSINIETICVVIDTSSSMDDGKLIEVQGAALQFVRQQDLSRCSIAVVQFNDRATLLVPPSNETSRVESAIQQMGVGGSTAMHDGLAVAEDAMKGAPGQRHILMFTDGYPDSESTACSAAREAMDHGIQIIAIGTGDADQSFLAKLTGDRRRVLWANPGGIEQAFEEARAMIARTSLVDAQVGSTVIVLVLRAGLWTSLLASGLGLALIAGQNCYMRRQFLSWPDLLKGGGGSWAAGFVAGAAGQTLFWMIRTKAAAAVSGSVILGAALGGFLARCCAGVDGRQSTITAGVGAATGLLIATLLHWLYPLVPVIYYMVSIPVWGLAGGILAQAVNRVNYTAPESRAVRRGHVAGCVGAVALIVADVIGLSPTAILTDTTTRIIGWLILGAALGRGMALFVPNLDRFKAMIAGAGGGLVGVIAMLLFSDHLGESFGRILGAAVLGGSIGIMTAVAELASRKMWLEVTDTSGEVRVVNLGQDPVTIDGDGVISAESRNCAPAVGLCYRVDGGRVTCEDVARQRRAPTSPGITRTIDRTTITIHGP